MATAAGEVLENVRSSFTVSGVGLDDGSEGPFVILVLKVVDPSLGGHVTVLVQGKVQGCRTDRS